MKFNILLIEFTVYSLYCEWFLRRLCDILILRYFVMMSHNSSWHIHTPLCMHHKFRDKFNLASMRVPSITKPPIHSLIEWMCQLLHNLAICKDNNHVSFGIEHSWMFLPTSLRNVTKTTYRYGVGGNSFHKHRHQHVKAKHRVVEYTPIQGRFPIMCLH